MRLIIDNGMEYLLSLDKQVFFLINHLPHTGVLDFFAETLSGLGSGGFIFFLLGLILLIREEEKDHRFILPFLMIFGIGWALSEVLLKTTFGRIRPEEVMGALIVGTKPDGYSFPSTHTLLAFAGAYVLSWKEPAWRWWLYILAGLIGLSRIYLGHHYPIDVVAGGIIGVSIGFCVVHLTAATIPKRSHQRGRKK